MSDDRRNPEQPTRRAPARRGGRRVNDEPEEWLSITRYAERYDVSRPTVYKWLRAQLLDTYQAGSLIRIRNLPPRDHRKCKPA